MVRACYDAGEAAEAAPPGELTVKDWRDTNYPTANEPRERRGDLRWPLLLIGCALGLAGGVAGILITWF